MREWRLGSVLPSWARFAASALLAAACGDPSSTLPDAAILVHQTLAEAETAEAARNPVAAREEAQADFLRSSAMAEGTLNDQLGLLVASLSQRDWRAVCQALTAIARRDPVTFDGINDEVVFGAFRNCRDLPREDETRFQLLGAAFDAGYVSSAGDQPSWVWRDLAILALEHGDLQRGEQVATQITSPIVLIDVRADNRFLRIVEAHPAQFDVMGALERELSRQQHIVESHPRSLEATVKLISTLSLLGRNREALDLADGALRSGGPWDDLARTLPWLRNQRSDVLWSLGRWQEAIDELKRAMTLEEFGQPNTSQVINLAQRYTALQQPQLALEVLDSVGQQSPWGEMELELARLEAEDEAQDGAAVAWSLDFMRVHEKDARPILQMALVQEGLLDEAVGVLEAQLADPIERSEALRSLQDYTGGPDFTPPSPARWAANQRAFRARRDVQEAIAKVGRIERYELPQQ